MSPVELPTPIIMAVSDRTRLGARGDDAACQRLVEGAAALSAAGVNLIQIRKRGLTDRRLDTLVREVLVASRATKARVIVNERTDVALTAGAAGVHLPSSAPGCARVRALVPAGFLVGRSVHATDLPVLREREAACDYLLFGTVFPSVSKGGTHPVAGLEPLRAISEVTSPPVLAIGGMNVPNSEEVARAGAAGIAAIGLFADPMRSGGGAAAVERILADIVSSVRQAFERGATARWTQATDHH